ncbi:hemolysin family protein [Qingshengfaniella alkalisoli]|uniref:HlyC/CorC family transporter n=1 Tax=Qingshengfaniella alkalisoli TaxID=2599296 RepID=A0A5B8J312_9RHOB|nr:hemolysin family protein [Qingshengfaniella alkalisoli]QDY68660.1 HlyC/CorC family transporter [Qingshengfaniella alkalisoli]
MNDAEGSSSAAHSALANEEERQTGFMERLFNWSGGKPDSDSDEGEQQDATDTRVFAVPGLGNLRKMRVEDVAVPKGDIVAVPVETTLEELVAEFRENGFTRLPVYEGTLDMPLGMVHLKDVALKYGFNGGGKEFDLRSLLRPLLYAPPSMTLAVLMQKMQSQRMHMALVIDEYGGTDGLVTIEDLIEQVVGEIEDEHDVDEDVLWTREGTNSCIALAKTPVEDFEKEFGVSFDGLDVEEDIDTLGGLVFLLSGHVPTRGEVVRHDNGTEFEVIDADPRRIKRLRVRLATDSTNAN